MQRRPIRATLWLICALAFTSPVWAQRAQVTLELGFDGEVVADSWNPLKLTTRDITEAQLVLTLDQGTLREGESLAIYQADINAGGGVAVFEDDLYLPSWRSLSWRLLGADEVLASGTLDRRNLDARPLNLIVSAAPSRWRDQFENDARVMTIPPSILPERLAAFDGVSSLTIDGSASMPNLEAVLAAATAGAKVILIDPLPASHKPLEALVTRQTQAGAGGLYRTSRDGLANLVTQLNVPTKALTTALLTPTLSETPDLPAQFPLLVASGAYLLLVLVLVRLAGAPGLVASAALALLASLAAWSYLRPSTALNFQGRSLLISSGNLARRDDLRTVFTLPQTTLTLPEAARPFRPVPHSYGPDTFELELNRWASEALFLKPYVTTASLHWEGGELLNTGAALLNDVYVQGLGPQGALEPGSRLTPSSSEDTLQPDGYEGVLELLPDGTALARDGGIFHIGLAPPQNPVAGLEP